MTTNKSLPGRARGLVFWLASALVLLCILLSAMLTWTLAGGASAKAALRAQYPPPGQMIDIGGRSLHIACQGAGSPTVITEAGLGDFSPVWALVQPQVAAATRVCAYDRAGMGWSERSAGAHNAATIVADLHMLLERANIAGPYVLVGHSLGGMYVRLYAYTYPQDVAGLVLVDASHEDQRQRFPAAYEQAENEVYGRAEAQVLLLRLLTTSGSLARNPARYPASDKLPPAAAAAYRALGSLSSQDLETIIAEHKAIDESSSQVRAARERTLGNMPLIVLSHGQATTPSAGFNLPADILQQQEQVWNELQVQLAKLSPNGRRIIASQSGHYIQLDQPDLVISAIVQALAELRR